MSDQSEKEFTTQWRQVRRRYSKWGKFLVKATLDELKGLGINPKDIFLVPPKSRLKATDSLVDKVFYRTPGKYQAPWNEIEDFVGARFVVLLERDLEIVQQAIANISGVKIKVAQAPQERRRSHPSTFDYVSVHLICSPEESVRYCGVDIPANTPCEVQIRTVLQHAWSEVSHSTVYKSDIEASDSMRRNVAKSSALVEATGDYFDRIYDEIKQREEQLNSITQNLIPLYRELIKKKPAVTPIEGQVLDAYLDLILDVPPEELVKGIDALFHANKALAVLIRNRASEQLLFKNPSILLIYYLVKTQRHRVSQIEAGVPYYLLGHIYNDLGYSIT